jgi:hypothetical protein
MRALNVVFIYYCLFDVVFIDSCADVCYHNESSRDNTNQVDCKLGNICDD